MPHLETVTADNGCEFSDFLGMETSLYSDTKRFILYFAHPYRACERGTNENHNGIIRRFLPKGTNFACVPHEKVSTVQNWMNSYPRKILNGLTPLMVLQKSLGHAFSLPD